MTPVDGGQRQPAAGQQRPRPHGDDDGVGGQFRIVDDGAGRAFAVRRQRDALHAALDEPRAAFGCGSHHGFGEGRGMDLRRRLGGAQPAVYCAVRAEPVGRGQAREPADIPAFAGDDAQRLDAAVAPVAAPATTEACRQFRVQVETAPRERRDRSAVAPVARQKAAGLAGRGIGDAGAFDDERFDAALAQKVGDGRPDNPAAADQDFHAARLNKSGASFSPRVHSGSCCNSRYSCDCISISRETVRWNSMAWARPR